MLKTKTPQAIHRIYVKHHAIERAVREKPSMKIMIAPKKYEREQNRPEEYFQK